MSKISVIYTGGTIGSNLENSVANVSANAENPLIDYYNAARPSNNVTFTTERLLDILSENIGIEHWKRIYNRVCAINHNDYDGIILTHGSDTLAYTSIFLSFMLRHVSIPILLVSSDYPLEDKRANGFENFTAAVDFILNTGIRGVFVPYTKHGTTQIHLGSRLLQAQAFSHFFMSLGNVWFGQISGGIFMRNDAAHNPVIDELQAFAPPPIPELCEIKDIFLIDSRPGIDYTIIDFARKPSAVLHGLYHSGTACVTASEERHSILPFAKKCMAAGIDFFAAPFDSANTVYATSDDMRKAGIKFLTNMSLEASYVKLLIAYSAFDNKHERLKFIEENIAFEQFLFMC